MRRWRRITGIVLIVLAAGVVSLGLVVSHDSPCGPAPAIASNTPLMKAIVQRCYGTPEVLRLEDMAKPVPADDEVLVRVHAASVNPLDWHYLHGTPYVVRMDAGLGRPDNVRLGVDFAGTVEAIGRSVKRFKPGDEVFGARTGAFAEYVTVREARAVVPKPATLTFEQAAAIPIAGVTALQALRDEGHVRPGQKVLIIGASGGVGTYAVQIAKALGAEVTGVCSTRNVEMVRALGADHVIDYTREDALRGGQRYDLILDNVGNRSLLELLSFRRILDPQGAFLLIGGGGPNAGSWIGPLASVLDIKMLSPFLKQQKFVWVLADLDQEPLTTIGDLMQAGKVTSVIDRRYSLKEVPAALGYLEAGHARGKVIITVE